MTLCVVSDVAVCEENIFPYLGKECVFRQSNVTKGVVSMFL